MDGIGDNLVLDTYAKDINISSRRTVGRGNQTVLLQISTTLPLLICAWWTSICMWTYKYIYVVREYLIVERFTDCCWEFAQITEFWLVGCVK